MALNNAQLLLLLNQATPPVNQLQMSNLTQNQPMGMNLNTLLNQATRPVNQLQMPNMTQNQPMGMNLNNMLAMINLLKAGQLSKPTLKNKFKRGKGSAKPTSGEVQKPRTRCVWVTGLPEDYQNADKLLNIFGNFGNVRKIVFSEKKADGVVIELDDARGPIKAVLHMNDQKLDGEEIKVCLAKEEQAAMNNDARSKDLGDAKENWRFADSKKARWRNICLSKLKKLSTSIFVLNVPEGKSDQLKKYIIESGYTVKSITEGTKRPDTKDKPSSGYTVAFVELASVEEAIAAVANLHDTWPKKFGTKKNDINGNARGLAFYFGSAKQESKA